VRAVRPRPINVLMSSNAGLTMADLAELGVRRVSTGSALARAAWGGFLHAARLVAGEGRFDGLDGAAPFAELNGFFRDDLKARS
jgi:2-methylisocitrate lyase-like PEP mutase family enzyme